MENYKSLLEEMQGNIKKLSKKSPAKMKSFLKFKEEVEKKEKLNLKTKALIGIACAITGHCEWCIAAHVQEALDAKATEEEILEASWVAVLMGGGPALMYAQGVLKALEDLKK